MNFLIKIFYRIPSPLRNKYFILMAVFAAWLIFFDHNNLINQYQTHQQLHVLLMQRKFYKNEINEINETKKSLFSNADNLERFAREKYLMKKKNEDLFIIEKDSSK